MPQDRKSILMPKNKNYQEGYERGRRSGEEEGARTMAKLLIATAGVTAAQATAALEAQLPYLSEEANNIYRLVVKEFGRVERGEIGPLPHQVFDNPEPWVPQEEGE